jgi:hypothetical protein
MASIHTGPRCRLRSISSNQCSYNAAVLVRAAAFFSREEAVRGVMRGKEYTGSSGLVIGANDPTPEWVERQRALTATQKLNDHRNRDRESSIVTRTSQFWWSTGAIGSRHQSEANSEVYHASMGFGLLHHLDHRRCLRVRGDCGGSVRHRSSVFLLLHHYLRRGPDLGLGQRETNQPPVVIAGM